jgi:5'-3' exonuclease
MGVKDLTKLVREKVPHAISNKSIQSLSGKRIAIDTYIYIFKYKCVLRERWMDGFNHLCLAFKQNDVAPMFVFDSKAPPEKLCEQKRRREDAQKRKEATDHLKDALIVYKETNVLDEQLYHCHLKLQKKNDGALAEPVKLELGDIGVLEEFINKRDGQCISITSDDVANLKTLFHLKGVRWTQALEESEATCSYLYHQNDVDFILTDDSDIMAYGCSYLTKMTADYSFSFIDYETVLDHLEFSKEEFVDFCILLGTDYNTRKRGFGPVKCIKTIREYGSLENVPAYHDIDYKRIRELFSYQVYNTFVKDEPILNVDRATFFFANYISQE